MTKANTGEVFPGATSPLGLTVCSRSLDLGVQFTMREQFGKLFQVDPWWLGRFNLISQNQVFLNVIDCFQRDVENEITSNQRSVDMAIFGRL